MKITKNGRTIGYIHITNQELFDRKVDDLEITGAFGYHGDRFHGDVVINDNCISGEHGLTDYEDEYGFRLSDYDV